MAYIGSTPVPQGIKETQSFTATAGQTTFNTLGYSNGNNISVFLNGVRLINGTDYTATNGSDIVLTAAASASDVLDFETFNEFNLVNQNLTTPTFTDSASVTSTTTASVSVSGDTTATVTLKNNTHEDTDGGRESTVIFQGEQSGGEISTLAEIEASPDGTADDQKGDLIFKTNDGSDNAAPTEALKIDSNQRLSMTRGDTLTELSMDANRSGSGASIGRFNYFWNGTHVAKIEGMTGSDTTNKDDGELRFQTRESGGALADRWKITSEGHFKAMSNGLGIDFSATEGGGASSSILDDYEEGTWTPAMNSGGTTLGIIANSAIYTKIGRFVHVQVYANSLASTTSSGFRISGLPFTNISGGQTSGSVMFQNVDIPGSRTQIVAYSPSSQDIIRLYALGDSTTWQEITGTNTGTTFNMIINIQYTTS